MTSADFFIAGTVKVVSSSHRRKLLPTSAGLFRHLLKRAEWRSGTLRTSVCEPTVSDPSEYDIVGKCTPLLTTIGEALSITAIFATLRSNQRYYLLRETRVLLEANLLRVPLCPRLAI